MTMKIRSFLPIFVVVAILGGDAIVYGDTGNLRGPINTSKDEIDSAQQATIIQPVHKQLRNGTLTPNEGTKRKRKRTRSDDTNEEEGNDHSYLLRGTIANAAANEVSAATPDDETKTNVAQDKHEQNKQKLAVLEDEISEIRQRIQKSQEQLRVKMQQQIIVTEDEPAIITTEKDEEQEDDGEEKELDSEFDSDSDDDCGYSFHQENESNRFGDSLASTSRHSHETCRLTSNIIHKSEIHARALIGDGECHFDTIHGHWYQASCVANVDDDDYDDDVVNGNGNGNRKKKKQRLPRFVFTKAFCSSGCEFCADPEDLPGVHGRPEDNDGAVFRTLGRPAYAVCELPPGKGAKWNRNGTKKRGKKTTEPSFVQYEGNCIRETCKDSFISTLSRSMY